MTGDHQLYIEMTLILEDLLLTVLVNPFKLKTKTLSNIKTKN